MIRLARSEDLSGLQQVIDEVGLTISGVSSPALTAALCRDALLEREVLIHVAIVEGQVAGYCIAIRDWKRYWKAFCLRHPILGARMLLHRRRRGAPDAAPSSQPESGYAWNDSTPQIAKILMLGVTERVRGMGLGVLIYRDFMKVLKARGVTRMDNLFDEHNHDSQRLHQFVGSRIVPYGRNFFAVTELVK